MIHCAPAEDPAWVQVTFTTVSDGLGDRAVAVVGDFNDWDPAADPMHRLGADPTLAATLTLAAGRCYRFRYLAEGGLWFDEENADGYQDNGLGQKNSVLDLTTVAGRDR